MDEAQLIGRNHILIFADVLFPLFFFFKRQTRKGETGKRRGSSIVERLRGKVSVIRNLGCNYMIARRKTRAGGISLLSKITNEFSLFLMEKSHICKIKSQCLFDERICRLCCPLFQILCAWKEEQGSETSSQGHWSRAGSWLHPPPPKSQGCRRLFQKGLDRCRVHGCFQEYGLV